MSVKHVHVANSHGLFIVNALVGEGEGGGGTSKRFRIILMTKICDFFYIILLKHESVRPDYSTGPYTVFAPEDDAFSTLTDEFNEYADTQVTSIIQYHIVDGYILVAMVSSTTNYTSLLGETIRVEPIGQVIKKQKWHRATPRTVCVSAMVCLSF